MPSFGKLIKTIADVGKKSGGMDKELKIAMREGGDDKKLQEMMKKLQDINKAQVDAMKQIQQALQKAEKKS